MSTDQTVILRGQGLAALIRVLQDDGYRTLGPVVTDGAIVHRPIDGPEDLPRGWHDHQEPGHYRLERSSDHQLFAWAVGPDSWKPAVLPARTTVWRLDPSRTPAGPREPTGSPGPVAMIGVRPCELAALGVLDRVLEPPEAGRQDPTYAGRRDSSVIVAVECGYPAATCFCASMGSGPDLATPTGADLTLTELDDDNGHRFLARVGSERGRDLLSRIPHEEATSADLTAREEVTNGARSRMSRELDAAAAPRLLADNLGHPRWTEVAERCLACGNCTMVCPTCFCTTMEDTADLHGVIQRERRWSSCFELDHSRLSSGPVRSSVTARYRQWLTHKLSTWVDQFGTSGCVGCGRCITWCPVGIDLTQEVAAIARPAGAGDQAGPTLQRRLS